MLGHVEHTHSDLGHTTTDQKTLNQEQKSLTNVENFIIEQLGQVRRRS